VNKRNLSTDGASPLVSVGNAYAQPILGEDQATVASIGAETLANLDTALVADIQAVSQLEAVASILEVVCRMTGMGFAAVARVTKDRWIACAVRDEIAFGLLPGGQLAVKTTICDEIRDSGRGVVIDHVQDDENFRAHHTPRMYGFQSYISMPIILPSGAFFGTLCAIDPRPAKLNRPEIIGMFKNFAQLIALQLDAQERAAKQDVALSDARQTSELREQFIAVLAHDLRNPLASIGAGAEMLLRRKPDEKSLYHRQCPAEREADGASDRRHARPRKGTPRRRLPPRPHSQRAAGQTH
jgi:GAF domain-containing protein